MSRSTKNFLRAQLIEMDRLAESAGDDPLMGHAIAMRRESLARELENAPVEPPKPRAVLFFAGPPVFGSRGIDAKFATDALGPFLEMVKTQYSAQKHGGVGSRGPRKGDSEARLLLTGLPRGSFGLELSQPQPEDFIAAEELSKALVRLTDVIASAGDNDERFAVSLDEVSPRVLPRLKEFLGVIASANANLGMESGELKVELAPERVSRALERVSAAKTEEIINDVPGVFRGATLDSWRFDFRLMDGTTLSGRLADEVEEEQAKAMIALTMRECAATLRITSITTSDGTTRRRNELMDLRPIERSPRIES
jgi:hypothetical protein